MLIPNKYTNGSEESKAGLGLQQTQQKYVGELHAWRMTGHD